jgi:hypothetical protein
MEEALGGMRPRPLKCAPPKKFDQSNGIS